MVLEPVVAATPSERRSGRPATRFVVALLLAVIAFGWSLPLTDILGYPDRISVLPSLQVDAATYDELGAAVASSGRWTDLPAMQPPGFVAILAVVYRLVGHSIVAAKLLLWLCLVMSTLLAGWFANRVWGGAPAWVAMTLTATAPALRHYVGTVQYEVLSAVGLLIVLGLAVKAVEARSTRAFVWVFAAGLAGGALTLVREVFIGVVPIIGLWIAVSAAPSSGRRRATAMLVLFLAVFGAPVAWWSALQSERYGRTIVLTDKGTATLALGNNPRASGTYNVDIVEQPAGLAFVAELPLSAARLALRKILYFWGLRRDWWNVPRPSGLWLLRASGGAIPLELSLPLSRGGWLLVAFVVSVWWLWRVGALRCWWVLPACVAAGCAAHVITLSSHRFAVPFLPVVFIVIAGPMAALAGASWNWATMHAARLCMVTALLFGCVIAQWSDRPAEFVFRASDMDGMNAENIRDTDTGRTVRYVPAAAGPRQAMVLADEYLPAGRFQLLLTARRQGPPLNLNTPVARVALANLDGSAACTEEIPWGMIPDDRFGKIWVPCTLSVEGPATLVVQSLGMTDIFFDEVALVRALPGISP